MLILSLAPRRVSSGTPVFPSFQKSTISNFSSNWNARTPVKQVLQIRAGMLMVGKQISFYFFNFSLRVFNRFGIRDTGYALFEGQDSRSQVK